MDSSTSSLTVALFENEYCIAQNQEQAERNHSVLLMPKIEQILNSNGVKARDLGAIAVGLGPGSYTGVRIGVTVAKTMAWAVSADVIGVSSLSAMALGASRKQFSRSVAFEGLSIRVVPMIYARRGQVYSGLYEITGNLVKEVIPDQIRLASEWMKELRLVCNNQEMMFVASPEDCDLCYPLILENQLQTLGSKQIEICSHAIQAYDIGVLAYPKWLSGETEELHTLAPNYTQLPEAEVKFQNLSEKGESGVGH